MQWPSYAELHPGASGGTTDPVSHAEWLPGAKHWNAGEVDGAKRNAYYRAPGAGQAPSARRYVRGVLSNDKGHDLVMDGHQGSALAGHPDGLFAQQTAASSQNSLNANYELPTQAMAYEEYLAEGQRTDLQPLPHGGFSMEVTKGRLFANRADRRDAWGMEPEILVAKRSDGVRRFGDFLSGEWQVPQLAGLALGGYTLVSAFA